jgi:hypothetical protein
MPDYAQDPQTPFNSNSQNPASLNPAATNPSAQNSTAKNSWEPAKYSPEYYEKQDLRCLVEQELRQEFNLPSRCALHREKIEFHRRQLALLEQANKAPRCEHVYSDGRCCGAPRVRKGKLCYAHTLMDARRPRGLNLPPLEDANAVMLWLMEVSRGLLEGQISERTAGLMFYGLQLAMVNARWTTFKETKHAEMVRKAPREDRRETLPLMNTDDTDREGITAKGAKVATEQEPQDFTGEDAENAEEAEPKIGRSGDPVIGRSEEIPGVESAKSLSSGVEGMGEERSSGAYPVTTPVPGASAPGLGSSAPPGPGESRLQSVGGTNFAQQGRTTNLNPLFTTKTDAPAKATFPDGAEPY